MRMMPQVALMLLVGCYSGNEVPPPLPDAGPGASAAAADLPCDVSALLVGHCIACHNSASLAEGATVLTTYDALIAPSVVDPGQTVAQRAVARMHDTRTPMPPPPYASPSADQVASFETWVAAGAPREACATDAGVPPMLDAGPSPYDTPTVCTSGSNWSFGNHGLASMRPGGACIDCHSRSFEGPRYTFAGTLYPTAHEPNDCNGVSGGAATIIVEDSGGHTYTMTPNGAGNFGARVSGAVMPYVARVVFDGRERAMATPQMSGDCNACHTEMGDEMAPGRIMLP